MTSHRADATPKAAKHYLNRIAWILGKLALVGDPQSLLDLRLAPEMFETSFNIAIAIAIAIAMPFAAHAQFACSRNRPRCVLEH